MVEISINHHLSQGVDELLVLDNGSNDGTTKVLSKLARNGRVRWTSEPGPFRSAEMYTELAQEAGRRGAHWVLPTGADEFWSARSGTIGAELAQSSADVIEVAVVTFIQRRGQLTPEPSGILTMTRRASPTIGPAGRAALLMSSGLVSYVELDFPTRIIFRPSSEIELSPGAHRIMGADGTMDLTDRIQLLHAPLRARSMLLSKAEKGLRIEAGGAPPGTSWHLRHWAAMAEDQLATREWLANSYDESTGNLSVAGVDVETTHDPTLQMIATPWVTSAVTLDDTSSKQPRLGIDRVDAA